MSLVTLIPAYKATHLGAVLASLAAQTWRDFRVVVSDDSPDGSLQRELAAGRWRAATQTLDLQVVAGPRLGSMRNIQQLLSQHVGGAEWVHLMMDDDLVYPGFYAAHVRAHQQRACGASVSRRASVDGQGAALGVFEVPAFIEQAGAACVYLGAPVLAASCIAPSRNWLGELSHAVYTRDAAAGLLRAQLDRLSYYGLGDLGLSLAAARHSPLAFINEVLGAFRSHGESNTAARQSFGTRCGNLAWVALALDAWRLGWLTPAQVATTVSDALTRTRREYADLPEEQAFIALVERNASSLPAFDAAFGPWWHGLLAAWPEAQLTVPA